MHSGFREIRRQQWFQIIRACENRPRGMSIAQWTTEHQISIKSYEYWKRKFRLEALEQKTSDKSPVSLTAPDNATDLSEKSGSRITFAEVPISTSQTQNSFCAPTSFTPNAVMNISGITIGFANSASPELIDRILKAVTYVS